MGKDAEDRKDRKRSVYTATTGHERAICLSVSLSVRLVWFGMMGISYEFSVVLGCVFYYSILVHRIESMNETPQTSDETSQTLLSSCPSGV